MSLRIGCLQFLHSFKNLGDWGFEVEDFEVHFCGWNWSGVGEHRLGVALWSVERWLVWSWDQKQMRSRGKGKHGKSLTLISFNLQFKFSGFSLWHCSCCFNLQFSSFFCFNFMGFLLISLYASRERKRGRDLQFFVAKCICWLCLVIQIVVYSWQAQLNSSVSHMYIFPDFEFLFSCCKGRGFGWREGGGGCWYAGITWILL